ncbi:hypothetical protein C4F40_18215 [Sphingobacterium sp. Ka21]|uniref:histidine kinase n=2 Tax=Sphingobacterium pedocola TaxID=2082722 RepID=A0ABR9TBJ3_9SPHI|nr:hypothetical protein [Sphingobacterium pedocola]
MLTGQSTKTGILFDSLNLKTCLASPDYINITFSSFLLLLRLPMKKLLFLIALLIHTCAALSQETDFIFRDLRMPERLKNRIITDVERDRAGLLWLSTNSGLCRYDGNEVIFFNNKSHPDIPNSKIKSIFADAEDNMWIGTENGLTRFDLQNWKTVEIKHAVANDLKALGLNIESIGEGRNGNIYVGSLDGKLYIVQKDSLNMIFDINKDFPDLYTMPAIASVQEPYPGELWLRTEIGKMIRIRIKDGSFAPPEYFGLPEFDQADIREVYFHSTGKCLLNITGHGLYLFDTRSGAFEKIPAFERNKLGTDGIVFLSAYKENEVLIFTNQPGIGKEHMFIYNFATNTTSTKRVAYPENLKDSHIEWFKNPGNTLLMAFNNHVLELVPRKNMFKSMLNDAAAINSIRGVYKHDDGKLYIGSYKDRFISFDEKTGEKEVLGKPFVYSILPWNKDTLLLGTEGDGLYWYEMTKKRLSPIKLLPRNKRDRPAAKYITTLTRAARNTVWVGTYAGLILVDPYMETYEPVRQRRLEQAKILSVVEVGNDIWIGTPSGLLIWNKSTNTLKSDRNIDPVYCITPVGNTLWVGTHGSGIRILDQEGGVLQTLANADGLADDIVYSIMTNGRQVVAATHNGLSIVDETSKYIRNYSRLDQLPANEFNHAAAYQRDNVVYLGTVNGLLRYDMDLVNTPRERSAPHAMPLYVTSLTTEHVKTGVQRRYTFPYETDSRLVIEPGTRYFTIGFGGQSELAEDMQFFYRLKEQSEWLPLGNKQEITFVEMPPGNYNLQLTSRFPDGQFTDSELLVQLVVKPTFYQTIWFKGILVLILGAIIWAIFRYREYTLHKERRLRISIASDLHDEVGSSLTRIYYQADNLTLNGRSATEGHLKLRQIADTSRHALSTMSDMVWSIDSRFDTVKDLVFRMKDYVYKLREECGFSYRLNVKGAYETLTVSQIVRQNLFLIFKEAITNVIKYGDGSEVMIELLFDDSICLTIRNNYTDQGNKLTYGQGGRGVENMRLRAEKMNAQLTVIDEQGTFRLVVHIR